MAFRVVQIVSSLDKTSGIVNFVFNLQEELVNHGIIFDYVYYHDSVNSIKSKAEEMGSRFLKVDFFQVPVSKKEKEKINAFLREDVLIIHNHELVFSKFLLPYIKNNFPEKVTIGHAHSSSLSNTSLKTIRNYFFVRNIENLYDYAWGCSRQALNTWFNSDKIRTAFVPNPIPCKQIMKSYQNYSGRKESNIFHLGTVGRLSIEKNQMFLLDVLEELNKTTINGREYHLTIIGEGDLKEKLLSQASKKNLKRQFHIIGYLPKDKLYDKMLDFDLFLFPSLFEGLGNTLIEAQSLGIKCIANSSLPKESDLGLVQYLKTDKISWAREISSTKRNESRITNTNHQFCSECAAQEARKLYQKSLKKDQGEKYV